MKKMVAHFYFPKLKKCYQCEVLIQSLAIKPYHSRKKNGNMLAERGFDPRTSGLWAQHASTAPLCFLLTYTPSEARSNCFGKTLPGGLFFVFAGLYTINVVVAEWLRRWT